MTCLLPASGLLLWFSVLSLGEETSGRNTGCAWVFVLWKQVKWLGEKALGLSNVGAECHYSSVATRCEKWWEIQRCWSQSRKNPFPSRNVVRTECLLVPEGSDRVRRGIRGLQNNKRPGSQSETQRIRLGAEFCSFGRYRTLSRSPVWRAAHRPRALRRARAGNEDDLRRFCCAAAIASPRLTGRELIHIDRDAADTRSHRHGNQEPEYLSTYFRNLIKLGSRTAAVVSMCYADSRGLVLWCSGDFWPSLGQTVENVGIAGQMAE